MKYLINKLPLIILFICVISTFLVRYTYISFGLSSIMLILSLFLSKTKKRIMIVTIIICLATIITDIFILYNNKSYVHEDIFKDTNILVGNLGYNFDVSAYIFNDDFSYIHYDDIKNKDNYCAGTYYYSFGGIGKNNEIIYEDNNYYYYNLYFKKNYCILDEEKEIFNSDIRFVFGINKNDYNDFTFIDITNNHAFKVVRKLIEK